MNAAQIEAVNAAATQAAMSPLLDPLGLTRGGIHDTMHDLESTVRWGTGALIFGTMVAGAAAIAFFWPRVERVRAGT